MSQTTPQRTALQVVTVLAEAIRGLDSVPSGHLYAQVMSYISLTDFTAAIGVLKRAKLVAEDANELRWVGPKVVEPPGRA